MIYQLEGLLVAYRSQHNGKARRVYGTAASLSVKSNQWIGFAPLAPINSWEPSF